MPYVVRVRRGVTPQVLANLVKPDAPVVKSVTDAVDPIFRRYVRRNFDTESSAGVPFKPLTQRYKKRKDALFSMATAINVEIARARGRRLTSRGLAKALGAENKILQLTGDMRRAFTRPGGPHIADGFIFGSKIRIRLGAWGPVYFGVWADPVEMRDYMQPSKADEVDLREAALKAMVPHVVKRYKELAYITRRR